MWPTRVTPPTFTRRRRICYTASHGRRCSSTATTVALAATGVFYIVNGFELIGEDNEVHALVMDAAEGLIDSATIAARLKPMVIEHDMPDEGVVVEWRDDPE